MNDEQTPLQRAEEALRAAGFRPMRGHGQWSRDRPDIGVLEVVEMFDAKTVTISLWPDIAVLPAVLDAMSGKYIPSEKALAALTVELDDLERRIEAGEVCSACGQDIGGRIQPAKTDYTLDPYPLAPYTDERYILDPLVTLRLSRLLLLNMLGNAIASRGDWDSRELKALRELAQVVQKDANADLFDGATSPLPEEDEP